MSWAEIDRNDSNGEPVEALHSSIGSDEQDS